LEAIVASEGATPLCVGIVEGVPVVGLSRDQLATLLAKDSVAKANTANMGVLLHRRRDGATTVSTTMECAAAAGVRVFATGGLGGVHMGYGQRLDISADLAAFTRFPVAVVTSGVKSILDVVSTREALETLGVCVVGFRTDRFPAFYLRESEAGVDARFDDERELASFVKAELARTGRGIVVANPIPAEHELPRELWQTWLAQAVRDTADVAASGRDVTPALLGRLHALSGGRTLAANIELVKSNARLAAKLAAAMG
jgi:pseudouridine-5'-phosphate glycosidase